VKGAVLCFGSLFVGTGGRGLQMLEVTGFSGTGDSISGASNLIPVKKTSTLAYQNLVLHKIIQKP
jgi:hypothetical protein